jgi:hypothetical protein
MGPSGYFGNVILYLIVEELTLAQYEDQLSVVGATSYLRCLLRVHYTIVFCWS